MKNKKVAEKPKAVIYCGPSIRNIVQQFAVFKGNIPAVLKDFSVKCPAVNQLLISAAELGKVRANLSIKGSSENVFYNQIKEYIMKGEK